LKIVKQMLQNNKLMKKTDSIEDASELVIKGQRERSKSRRPKRDTDASSSNACYYCRKPGHVKKSCMKYKKMLKKKGGKKSNRASTRLPVKNQNKPLLSKQMRTNVMS